MVQHDVRVGGRLQGLKAAEQRRNAQFAMGQQMTGRRSAEPGRNIQYIDGRRTSGQDRNTGYTARQRPAGRRPAERAGNIRHAGEWGWETDRRRRKAQYPTAKRDVRRETTTRTTVRRRTGSGKLSAKRRRNRRIKRLCALAMSIVLCLGIAMAVKGMWQTLAGLSMELPGQTGVDTGFSEEGSVPVAVGMPDFTEELQELLEKNEETRDYVENYPNREQYRSQAVNLTEDFTSGEVPLLMQWDKRWGYDAYGDSMIGLAGCGPLCLDMAYLYFTEDLTMTPRRVAEYVHDSGYHTDVGTSWSLWTEGVSELGLEGSELSLDESAMKRALDTGGLIVCSMRPGDFTTTGHFILIRGYGKDGFYVNDPNRRSTSGKTWTFDTLKSQIKNLWVLREGS